MITGKFVALEPISEPDCKGYNHERRISVTAVGNTLLPAM